MQVKKVVKKSFVVIGIEGSTTEGEGFIQRRWMEANSRFNEIQHLVKKAEDGKYMGFWGAMSDFSMSFKPWENNFSEGLYLAGAECVDEAQAPRGWTKWVIPSYEYFGVECEGNHTFLEGLHYLEEQGYSLVVAVHDFTCPKTGKNFMFFPIRKLDE